MEYSMRDLDRLQEHDPDERGRHLGVWLVLAALLIGVFGAAFLVWNRAAKSRLDELDPLEQLGAAQSSKQRDGAKEAKSGTVDPMKLTFERALTGEEERPEVIAALAAAAREEAELAAATEGEGATDEDEDGLDAPELPTHLPTPSAGAQIPAGLTASSAGTKLERAARHDKLVAAALPKTHTHNRASSGSDGEFILHVISYESKSEADAFASALRDRGHEAFVTAGQVDGRSRTYRVRIGPFTSRAAADAYRRDFEERERMNTIVVRRDDE